MNNNAADTVTPTRITLASSAVLELRPLSKWSQEVRASMTQTANAIVNGVIRSGPFYGEERESVEPERALGIWGSLIASIEHPAFPDNCTSLDALRGIAAGIESRTHHPPITEAARTVAANTFAELNSIAGGVRLLELLADAPRPPTDPAGISWPIGVFIGLGVESTQMGGVDYLVDPGAGRVTGPA